MSEIVEVTNEQLQNMTSAEIRIQAQKEEKQAKAALDAQALAEDETEAEPVAQARDDKGRFAGEEKPAPVVVAAPQVYRRVIDMGGDSGSEVFEADSLEGLVDKITAAKGNASKKIREQELELRTFRSQKQEQEQQITADEEFISSQELLSKPSEAFKKLFKQTTGVDISEFKNTHQRAAALVDAQDKQKVAANFIATHPLYEDNARNGQLLSKWTAGITTEQSLNQAYLELTESGLLTVKDSEKADPNAEPTLEPKRIAEVKAEVKQAGTKKTTGVSTHAKPSAVVVNQGFSADEAKELSIDKLRALSTQQIMKGN